MDVAAKALSHNPQLTDHDALGTAWLRQRQRLDRRNKKVQMIHSRTLRSHLYNRLLEDYSMANGLQMESRL